MTISPVPFKSLLRTIAPVKYISILRHTKNLKNFWDLIWIQPIFAYHLL